VRPARLQWFVFYPGGSAMWPQCWLCAVCAVGRVGCCVGGGGVPCGGKHIIIVEVYVQVSRYRKLGGSGSTLTLTREAGKCSKPAQGRMAHRVRVKPAEAVEVYVHVINKRNRSHTHNTRQQPSHTDTDEHTHTHRHTNTEGPTATAQRPLNSRSRGRRPQHRRRRCPRRS